MMDYESAGRVAASAARRILVEAGAVERSWWRGGVGFEAGEGDRPGILRGRTPLFNRAGASDEEDLFMAFADALFIARLLAGWAERFGVKWRIGVSGEDWGAIDPGGFTKPFLERMDKWARRAGVPRAGMRDWEVSEDRREGILARHGGGGESRFCP